MVLVKHGGLAVFARIQQYGPEQRKASRLREALVVESRVYGKPRTICTTMGFASLPIRRVCIQLLSRVIPLGIRR